MSSYNRVNLFIIAIVLATFLVIVSVFREKRVHHSNRPDKVASNLGLYWTPDPQWQGAGWVTDHEVSISDLMLSKPNRAGVVRINPLIAGVEDANIGESLNQGYTYSGDKRIIRKLKDR